MMLPRSRSTTPSGCRPGSRWRRSRTATWERSRISTIDSSAMASIAVEFLAVRIPSPSSRVITSPTFSGTAPSPVTWNSSPSTASMRINPPDSNEKTLVLKLNPIRLSTTTAAAARRQPARAQPRDGRALRGRRSAAPHRAGSSARGGRGHTRPGDLRAGGGVPGPACPRDSRAAWPWKSPQLAMRLASTGRGACSDLRLGSDAATPAPWRHVRTPVPAVRRGSRRGRGPVADPVRRRGGWSSCFSCVRVDRFARTWCRARCSITATVEREAPSMRAISWLS